MSFTVSQVAPGELSEACRVLFVPDSFTTSGFDPNGLFVAKDERGTIHGAVLAQVLPGAVGAILPPRVVVEQLQLEIEDALISAACAWLQSNGVRVCQSFASEDERPAMASLERGGFQRVTQLSNMRREIDPRADRFPPGESLEGEFFSPHLRKEFCQLLLATYQGTLDCPELNDVRSSDEVFEGFTPYPGRVVGPWFLVKEAGQPVGVVMLDRAREPEEWEVAYLGVIPSVRGRGWSGKLIRFALDQAAAAGVGTVCLSVDVRNIPAIRSYRSNGFFEYDRQDVYLSIWTDELRR